MDLRQALEAPMILSCTFLELEDVNFGYLAQQTLYSVIGDFLMILRLFKDVLFKFRPVMTT